MTVRPQTTGFVVVLVALLGLSFGSTTTAQTTTTPVVTPAPTADQILQRCKDRLAKVVANCEAANKALADRCLPRIQHIVATGDLEAAKRLARACCRRIRARSTACVKNIGAIRRHCDALIHNAGGGPGVLKKLRRACKRAVRAVRDSQRTQCRRLRTAADG